MSPFPPFSPFSEGGACGALAVRAETENERGSKWPPSMGPRALVSATAALFVALLGALFFACSGAQESAPNVVLIVVDALRVDRMSVYGVKRPTTVNLERLASTGALFTDAWSPAPWTVPSVASILTGLHPLSHGAGQLGPPPLSLDGTDPTGLADDAETIADRLARVGYVCESFTANAHVNNLLKAFHERVERAEDGSDVADFAVSRLRRAGSKPLFLYLHFMECHDPILSPDEDLLAALTSDEPARIPDFWARS